MSELILYFIDSNEYTKNIKYLIVNWNDIFV